MNLRHFLLLLSLMFSLKANAGPEITLMTFEGYTFKDKFKSEFGRGSINGGFQWGVGAELKAKNNTSIELIYQGMRSQTSYVGLQGIYKGKMNTNYIMAGATQYIPFHEKVSAFGTFNLGVGWFNPEPELGEETVTKFSLGGRVGVRYMATEKLSVRIHFQMLSPVQWAGAGFYVGTGGVGSSVSTGSTIYQFNLGGSINFRIK
jgi:hypothetical protein